MKMASGDSAGVVKVWICGSEGWRMMHSFSCQDLKGDPIVSLRFHPFLNRLLVHVRDSIIRAVDLRTYTVTMRYPGAVNERVRVRSIYSPCGSLVLAGSEDGRARVWQAESGMLLSRLEGLGTTINDVAFHPREHLLAVCSLAPNQPILIFASKGALVDYFDMEGGEEKW